MSQEIPESCRRPHVLRAPSIPSLGPRRRGSPCAPGIPHRSRCRRRPGQSKNLMLPAGDRDKSMEELPKGRDSLFLESSQLARIRSFLKLECSCPRDLSFFAFTCSQGLKSCAIGACLQPDCAMEILTTNSWTPDMARIHANKSECCIHQN